MDECRSPVSGMVVIRMAPLKFQNSTTWCKYGSLDSFRRNYKAHELEIERGIVAPLGGWPVLSALSTTMQWDRLCQNLEGSFQPFSQGTTDGDGTMSNKVAICHEASILLVPARLPLLVCLYIALSF